MNSKQEEHERKVRELEAEMMEWVEGRKSTTNMIRGTSGTQDNAYETMLIWQADAAEVQKLSAAIQALNSRRTF